MGRRIEAQEALSTLVRETGGGLDVAWRAERAASYLASLRPDAFEHGAFGAVDDGFQRGSAPMLRRRLPYDPLVVEIPVVTRRSLAESGWEASEQADDAAGKRPRRSPLRWLINLYGG